MGRYGRRIRLLFIFSLFSAFLEIQAAELTVSQKAIRCRKHLQPFRQSRLTKLVLNSNSDHKKYFEKHPLLYRGFSGTPEFGLMELVSTIFGKRTDLLSSHEYSALRKDGLDADQILEEKISDQIQSLGLSTYLKQQSAFSNGWNQTSSRQSTNGLWFSFDSGEAHSYGMGRLVDEQTPSPAFGAILEVDANPEKFLIPPKGTNLPKTEIFHPSHIEHDEILGIYLGLLPEGIDTYLEEPHWLYLAGPFSKDTQTIQVYDANWIDDAKFGKMKMGSLIGRIEKRPTGFSFEESPFARMDAGTSQSIKMLMKEMVRVNP